MAAGRRNDYKKKCYRNTRSTHELDSRKTHYSDVFGKPLRKADQLLLRRAGGKVSAPDGRFQQLESKIAADAATSGWLVVHPSAIVGRRSPVPLSRRWH